MKIKSLILNCDFLGYKQTFSIGTKRTFQSHMGSILSILITIILLYCCNSFSRKLFEHKNPNIVATTYYDQEIKAVEFDQNILTITLALQNTDYSYYIDEKIYKVTIYAISKQTTDSHGSIHTSEEQLQLVKCNEIHEFKLAPDYFMSLDLKNLYCLNLNQSIILEGEYGRNSWKYIQFRFQKCINSTENNYSCYSEEVIEKKLSGGYLGLFISHYAFVPNNYQKPLNVYGKNIFASFSGKYYSDFFMYLKTLQINTDTGFLLESFKTEEQICYSSWTSQNDHREEKEKHFISLTIQMSQEREVYERSYAKLQVIAAEIGGIMKVCLFVGEITIYLFRNLLYKDYISSFYFEKRENKKIKVDSYENNPNYWIQTSLAKNTSLNTQKNIDSCLNSDCLGSEGVLKRRKITNQKKQNSTLFGTNIDQFKINGNIGINNYLTKNRSISNTMVHSENKRKALNQIPNINTNNASFDFFNKRTSSFSKRIYQRNATNMKDKENEVNNFASLNILKPTEMISPQKHIKLWMIMGPCICNKKIKHLMKIVNHKYLNIAFLFDILSYLKSQNDLSIIRKMLIKDDNVNQLFRTYNFELPSSDEVKLFKYSLENYKRKRDFKRKITENPSLMKFGSSSNNFIELKNQWSRIFSDKGMISGKTDN